MYYCSVPGIIGVHGCRNILSIVNFRPIIIGISTAIVAGCIYYVIMSVSCFCMQVVIILITCSCLITLLMLVTIAVMCHIDPAI